MKLEEIDGLITWLIFHYFDLLEYSKNTEALLVDELLKLMILSSSVSFVVVHFSFCDMTMAISHLREFIGEQLDAWL
jgi:hypothetical protein